MATKFDTRAGLQVITFSNLNGWMFRGLPSPKVDTPQGMKNVSRKEEAPALGVKPSTRSTVQADFISAEDGPKVAVDLGRQSHAGAITVRSLIKLITLLTEGQAAGAILAAKHQTHGKVSKRVEVRPHIADIENLGADAEGFVPIEQILAALRTRKANDRVGLILWLNPKPDGTCRTNLVVFPDTTNVPIEYRGEMQNPLYLRHTVDEEGILCLTGFARIKGELLSSGETEID